MKNSTVIAIGENDYLFYRFAEGDGSNLLAEDEEMGYVDYIMLDFGNLIDAYGYVSDNGYVDGAQIMLKDLYQDMFKEPKDVIRHCIDCSFVPDQPYRIVYIEE